MCICGQVKVPYCCCRVLLQLSTAVRLARGLLADKVKEQREIRERTRQRKQEAAGSQQ